MCIWIVNNLYWFVPTISTIILTSFLIKISCKQNNLQQQGIQLDLFDKRFQLYTRLSETMLDFLDTDQAMSAYRKMGEMKDEVYFLFGEEIAKYYLKIINNAHIITNKKNESINEYSNALKWIKSQIFDEKGIRKQFEKYLSLRESGLSRR